MEITWFHNHQLKKKLGLGLGYFLLPAGVECLQQLTHFFGISQMLFCFFFVFFNRR